MFNTGPGTGMLPVPITPLNQQFAVQMNQLPMNPPVVPNINIGALQQYLQPITGYSMGVVQQYAAKNALRSFLFNLLSRNGWQNPEFEQFVSGVAQLAELFGMTINGIQVEQAVQKAAEEMASMQACIYAAQNEQAFVQFVDQRLANDIGVELRKYQTYQAQFQRLAQPQPAFGGGGMGGWPQQNTAVGRGYQPQQGRGVQFVGGNNAPRQMGQMWGNSPANNAVRGNSGGMWGNPQDNSPRFGGSTLGGGAAGGFGGGLGRRAQVEEVTLDAQGGDFRQFGTNQQGQFSELPQEPVVERRPITPASRQSSFQQGPSHVAVSAESEWPKVANPLRPWDSVLMEDGTEIRPAHISGWTKTVTEDQPYHLVYDPNQYMLFHVRLPNGDVQEKLYPRSEDMGYLDHELDPKLKAQVREVEQEGSGQVVAPNWGLAQALRPHPLHAASVPASQESSEATESTDIPSDQPVVFEEVIQAHSLAEAEVKLSFLARGDEQLRGLKPPYEFYFDQITPITVEKNEINTVRQLADCQTYESLLNKLYEVKPRLPEAVWAAVDERLTKNLNEALEKNLTLEGWSIDSFFGDFEDLLAALRPVRGDLLVDTFVEYAPEVIHSALSVLSGESFAKYLRAARGDSENGKDLGQHLLAFRDRTSVTYVPWKYSDLSLDLTHGGLVPENDMPELYAALEAILARTLDLPVTFAHRYIVTADKKTLEVRRGYLGKDSILLFEVK